MNELARSIIDTLKIICSFDKSGHHELVSLQDSYTYRVDRILPKNQYEVVSFVLPKTNNFKYKKSADKEYYIDIFNTHEGDNILNKNEFFNFILNTKNYSEYIRNSTELLEINDFYIERNFRTISSDGIQENRSRLQSYLEDWIANSNEPLLLVGDRGMGKTWAIRKFFHDQFDLHIENPWINPLPIYINLSELSKSLDDVSNFSQAIKYHILKEYKILFENETIVWESFLNSGKIIILLDGLDEMSIELSDEIKYRNLWEISNIQKLTNRLIITSRLSYFESYSDLLLHFKYQAYLNLKSDSKTLHIPAEKNIRQDYKVCILNNYDQIEQKRIEEKYFDSGNKDLIKGSIIIKKINDSQKEVPSIEQEILELSNIPAYHKYIASHIGNEGINLVNLYFDAILTCSIDYNIDEQRAIDSIHIYDNKEGDFSDILFDSDRKIKLLQEIAWTMFLQNNNSISASEIKELISSNEIIGERILEPDIRSQSVLTLNHANYKFINEGVFCFFVALFLTNPLLNKNAKSFFDNFGQFNFQDSKYNRNRILNFVEEIISTNNLEKFILQEFTNYIVDTRPFSPSRKYIFNNLQLINIPIDDYEQSNHWLQITSSNALQEEQMILIPNPDEPFLISETEVTNLMFQQFITDNNYIGKYFNLKNKNDKDNPFKNTINDYHLMGWSNDKFPINESNHPVVYISLFAAMGYCNWLSYIAGSEEFYKFIFKNGIVKGVELIQNSNGFRLPYENEWQYAAQEGRTEIRTIHELENIKLTFEENMNIDYPKFYSVRRGFPNKFGVFGLIGNVREWVNTCGSSHYNPTDYGRIKGYTKLLGDTGYKFNHYNEVFSQNTNIDVGFRVAKSLGVEDKNIIHKVINK